MVYQSKSVNQPLARNDPQTRLRSYRTFPVFPTTRIRQRGSRVISDGRGLVCLWSHNIMKNDTGLNTGIIRTLGLRASASDVTSLEAGFFNKYNNRIFPLQYITAGKTFFKASDIKTVQLSRQIFISLRMLYFGNSTLQTFWFLCFCAICQTNPSREVT